MPPSLSSSMMSGPPLQLAGNFLQALRFSFNSRPLNEFAITVPYKFCASFQLEEDTCAD